MSVYSLLYGIVSVTQGLLENGTVLRSFSRFDLWNEQAGEAGLRHGTASPSLFFNRILV